MHDAQLFDVDETNDMKAKVIQLAAVEWTDATLVEAAREGNERARRQIVERYGRHVAGVLCNTLGSSDDLDDLVQDTFLTVFRDLGALRGASHLKAWITRIAVRRVLHAIRSRRRKWWLRLVSPEDLPERTWTGPDAEHSQAVRATYEALDRLKEDERVAFTLRFMHGMSLDEVADALGVSLATAKRRLKSAEERFRCHAAHDARLASWVERSV